MVNLSFKLYPQSNTLIRIYQTSMTIKAKAQLKSSIKSFDSRLRAFQRTDLFEQYHRKRVSFSRHQLLPFFRDHHAQSYQAVGDIINPIKHNTNLLSEQDIDLSVIGVQALAKVVADQITFKDEDLRKYFLRTIKHQQYVIKERRQSFTVSYLDRPHFQKVDNFSVYVPCKKQQDLSFTLQGKKQELLQLREGKLVHPNIISNFLKMLKFTKKIDENVQIASLNFLPFAMRTSEGQSFCEQKAFRIVKSNFSTSINCLQSPILSRDISVLPTLIGNHYSLVIIKRQKDKYLQVIYCSSRYTLNRTLILAIYAHLKVEQEKYPKLPKINDKNIAFIQLLVPRQVRAEDSGLYLMLYAQTLLTAKTGLDNLDITNRNKLHLFPRIMAQNMRQRVWNLFVKLTDPTELNKMKIILDFFQERKMYNENANFRQDYDLIEKNQVKKLNYLTSGASKQDEEESYAIELEYYYNKILSYYEE